MMLKPRKHCSQRVSRRSDGDVNNSYFSPEVIDGEAVGVNSWPVLHEKSIVEVLRMQVLLSCNEDVTFRFRHNGRGAACHPLNSKWF